MINAFKRWWKHNVIDDAPPNLELIMDAPYILAHIRALPETRK